MDSEKNVFFLNHIKYYLASILVFSIKLTDNFEKIVLIRLKSAVSKMSLFEFWKTIILELLLRSKEFI